MKKILLLVGLFMFLATNAFAEAQTHDGFFLRLAPGLGQMSTKSAGITFEDMSGTFSLLLGGTVSDNTILHVELAGVSMDTPKASGNASGTLDGSLSTNLFGFGITHYIMPDNAYVSASIGTARTTLEEGGVEYDSDRGLGFNLTVGKEWWVSDDWGLGLAGHLFYAKCGGGFYGEDIKTLAYGLLFSATYN